MSGHTNVNLAPPLADGEAAQSRSNLNEPGKFGGSLVFGAGSLGTLVRTGYEYLSSPRRGEASTTAFSGKAIRRATSAEFVPPKFTGIIQRLQHTVREHESSLKGWESRKPQKIARKLQSRDVSVMSSESTNGKNNVMVLMDHVLYGYSCDAMEGDLEDEALVLAAPEVVPDVASEQTPLLNAMGDDSRNSIAPSIDDDHVLPTHLGTTQKVQGWRELMFDLTDHLGVKIFAILLVLLDFSLFITSLFTHRYQHQFGLVSDAIAIWFLIEMGTRWVCGAEKIMLKIWEVMDMLIVLVYATLTLAFDENAAYAAVRFLRLFLLIRLLTYTPRLKLNARRMVSRHTKRLDEPNFDLDLTYITDRILAMAFPASGTEAMYRNNVKTVKRLFDSRHKGHYKVYNLCSEKSYPPGTFDGPVARYYIIDHNVPSIEQMLDFCRDASVWLEEDTENVIAVHCKGGKGRTGTMICAYLLYSGQFDEPADCLKYYNEKRANIDKYRADNTYKNVLTPSQARYVVYFQKHLKQDIPLQFPPRMILGNLTVVGMSAVLANTKDFYFTIESEAGGPRFCSEDQRIPYVYDEQMDAIRWEEINFEIAGNTKLAFDSNKPTPLRGKDSKIFFFWIHTSFVKPAPLMLQKSRVDNAASSDVFPPYFSVLLELTSGAKVSIVKANDQ
eukprot:Clim_evm37s33 gene=Clim_evmTU37s33